jgi:hypothetical protein
MTATYIVEKVEGWRHHFGSSPTPTVNYYVVRISESGIRKQLRVLTTQTEADMWRDRYEASQSKGSYDYA